MANDMVNDNRFEVIGKAKEHLLEATNIDTSPDEMAVLDSFLFRCWQMGWLDRYDTADTPQIRRGKWVRDETDKWRCSACGAGNNYAYEWSVGGEKLQDNYCPKCGARMEVENETEPIEKTNR